ncbi:Alpha/beta hydrolase family-domain-containing protein [Aspergillus welwitschiae]|uniref:Alpha/beta hydrolase family-domain-containing protein n=1 Tax=Aspergillus welwitschiae TaxID=1341132 RepID=A0A3F3PIK6_9EURO|nr:Alpha/beta hydrolase family-domain-containing protein [Aspergillus welwitschiae]RDH26771.1 Alpha/beta hydrolase family-domain-containing protein [Aspergillus welwitschiae]
MFHVNQYRLPCQHLREYSQAVSTTDEEVLHLSVKEYIPFDNQDPKPGDVTILAAHANGFTKELYEPLWDDLLQHLQKLGVSIRAIWIADAANQGASYVLNEQKLGNEPSWFDHSRDLLHMVNFFRDRMPRPIIGMGHSMGACQLVELSLIHPSLFSTLVLIEPAITRYYTLQDNWLAPAASAARRDCWKNKAEAVSKLRQIHLYQQWDSRVLDRFLQYGLRDLPTFVYPETPTAEGGVTLTTPKYQEVFSFLRQNFPSSKYPRPERWPNKATHPDYDPTANQIAPFYCPAPVMAFHKLPSLRPSVLYLLGHRSHSAAEEFAKDKLALTGTGVGGSGGSAFGKVKATMLDAGHLLPLERVNDTAAAAANWIVREMEDLNSLTDENKLRWDSLSGRQKQMFSQEFYKALESGPPKLIGKL